MEKVPFTINGLEDLKNEFNNLKKIQRPEIIKAISIAREHGDLSENAEYHAAKEKQSFIEGRITELESVLSRAEVIDLTKLDGKRVTFGTKVTVYDEDADKDVEFSIVGPYEANLEKGLIIKCINDELKAFYLCSFALCTLQPSARVGNQGFYLAKRK